MRKTPVTTEYFEEELLPLFQDCMSLLLDEDPTADIIQYQFNPQTRVLVLNVTIQREDAARVIGREHRMRNALYTLFSAICKNHGFTLAGLNVQGSEQGAHPN